MDYYSGYLDNFFVGRTAPAIHRAIYTGDEQTLRAICEPLARRVSRPDPECKHQAGPPPSAATAVFSAPLTALSQKRRKHTLFDLQEPFTPFQLTPLHLAAIVGYHLAIDLLVSAGIDPNLLDDRGFSALHHTAMRMDHLASRTLLRAGANRQVRNCMDGTYQDIVDMGTWPDPSKATVRYLPPGSNALVVKTALELFGNGRTFSNTVFTPSELQWADYLRGEVASLSPYWNDRYQRFLTKPPDLFLRETTRSDAGPEINLGRHTATNVAIPAGEFVCDYDGEDVTGQPLQTAEHALGDESLVIDGGRIGSLGAMISDGLPNITQVNYTMRGRRRCGFIALRDIAPGESLYWDYETHSTKSQRYIEACPTALRQFLKEFSVSAVLYFLTQPYVFATPQHEAVWLEKKQYWESRLQYIASTPSVAISLLLDDHISPADVFVLKHHFPLSNVNVHSVVAAALPGFMRLFGLIDPTVAAQCKEQLRVLIAEGNAKEAISRVADFYDLVKGYEIVQPLAINHLFTQPLTLRQFMEDCPAQAPVRPTRSAKTADHQIRSVLRHLLSVPEALIAFLLRGCITAAEVAVLVARQDYQALAVHQLGTAIPGFMRFFDDPGFSQTHKQALKDKMLALTVESPQKAIAVAVLLDRIKRGLDVSAPSDQDLAALETLLGKGASSPERKGEKL